jgi:hypothetical protein
LADATGRKVVCEICSDRPDKIVDFLWKSAKNHVKTRKHAEASARKASQNRQGAALSASTQTNTVVAPAELNPFTFDGSDSDKEMDALDVLLSLFFSNGDVYQDGEQVMFSAGQSQSCEKDDQLRRQLSNMHLYRDEMLGTCKAWDEPDDEAEGILSVLRAMGMFSCHSDANGGADLVTGLEDKSDDEDEDLTALGVASTSNRGGDWYLYGSKTVCLQTVDDVDLADKTRYLCLISWTSSLSYVYQMIT